ncbi:MAG TPA: carboxypeptidase regulatory-like domain-containing protein [Bryobacteraceae bacterium]|nr:carboxypeptidase regulatory-like domain-containing protein [Bryobacteraceae bacterium]
MFHLLRPWALLLVACLLPAQDFRATLTGRVTDASNAPVPRSEITVSNLETGTKAAVQTDERGDYTVPLLPPGTYEMRATAAGFKQYIRQGITLSVGQTATLDIKLDIGEVTERVTVTAEVPLLETASSSRGTVIDNQRVSTLPLSGRNPFMLAVLASGVNFAGRSLNTRPFDNNFSLGFSMNGSRYGSGEFLLDGAPNNAEAGGNSIALVPSVDAVNEFKIQTNSYDAQYGKTGGGIINVSLKSGTNQLHGSAYEFMRRNALDANSFQNNARGAPRGGHTQDQYGGLLSGPVYIPKLYDGRNKSFFMVNYEGYRETLPVAHNLSAPTEAMRNGDFRQLVDGQGRPIIIYNPASGREVAGGWERTPFPGNVIPESSINPIAKRVLSYMPLPNTLTPGAEHAQQNLFIPGDVGAESEDFYNFAFKFDQNVGNNHRFFFRHANNDRVYGGSYNGIFQSPGTQGWYPHVRWNTSEVLDWVSTPSPSFIFNARLSISRYYQLDAASPNDGFDITTLGFPSSVARQIPNTKLPNFGLYDFDSYIGMGRTPSQTNTNTLAFHPNVTKIQGSHTIKGGMDMRWIQFSRQVTGSNFQFRSGRQFTQRDFALGDALSGNSIASWLVGAPASGVVANNLFPIYLYKYYAPWVQDNWKVSSRLTINLGLRWDFNTPANERYNRMNRGFDPTSTSSIDSLINRTQFPGTPTVRGGLQFAGVNGNPRTAADLYKAGIQPRVGFAYGIGNRLVVRGGWGRYYLNPNNDFLQSAGFSQSTSLVPSIDGGRTVVPGLLTNPYPNGILVPAGASGGDRTFLGNAFGFVNTGFKTPYVNQFSLGFQYQVNKVSRVEVSYVGSRTHNLQTTRPFNEFDAAFRQRCNPLEGGNPNFCNERVANPYQNLEPFRGTSHFVSPTLARTDLARPHSQFTSLTELARNDGSVWYNSMQASYEIRAHGFNMLASYTFSKMVEELDFIDVQRNVLQRGLFKWDRPHRLTVASIYELPFGKGQRWLSGSNAVGSRLVGGWQTAVNMTWQSGRPWDLPASVLYVKDARIDNVDWSASRIQGVRPCVSRMANDGSITMQPFSVSAGCTEPNFIVLPQYAPRVTPYQTGRIRLHTVPQADISFIKITPVTEKTGVEFRAEAFNAFNTFHFYDVPFDNNPNSANFGSIIKATAAAGGSSAPRQIQLAIKFVW